MRILKWTSLVIAALAAAACIGALLYQKERDVEGPVIQMDADTVEISVTAPESEMLAGITAADAKDGDVTDSLVVETLSGLVADNERTASIAAFDSDDHVTKVTRKIRYTDYVKPEFRLSAPFSFAAGTKTSSVTAGLRATDCLDGDISYRISRSNAEGSTLDLNVPGTYRMDFSVSNSAGDMEKFTATVEVYEREEDLPGISLKEAMVYLSRGEEFSPEQYLKSVSVDGQQYLESDGRLISAEALRKGQLEQALLAQTGEEYVPAYQDEDIYGWEYITIRNPVDTAIPGWYEVSYSVTSMMGTERTAYLLVRVRD